MTTPKKHHFIPQFYLRGFSDLIKSRLKRKKKKYVLWVYEKDKNIRISTPRNEAHRINYYTVNQKIMKKEQLEKGLGKMEGLAAGLIRCTRDRNFTFNGEDKSEMATFVALMFTRVPSGRDWINKIAGQAMKAAIQEEAKDIEKFKDEFSKRQEQLGPLGISPEDLRELILSNDYEIIQQSKDFNIAKILEVTLILAPLIENLNWQIWHANGSQLYITSDNPVVTAIRKGGSIQFGAGFGSHGVEVTFTLTSRAALFMAHGAQEISIGIGNARIREINKRIAWCANRFLYAPQYSTPLKKYLDQHGGKVKYGENAFLPPN